MPRAPPMPVTSNTGIASAATGMQVQPNTPQSYAAYDPAGPYSPVRFDAAVSGAGPGQWIAVAVNGVVAGIGRTHAGSDGTALALMLDPSLLRAGANDLSYFLVDGGQVRPIA